MILKLKRTPGIYMVGFMGSGKTTVGRSLARHLGWRYADLDEDIESRAQKSIPEIFDEFGEEQFRHWRPKCSSGAFRCRPRRSLGDLAGRRLLCAGPQLRSHPEPWRLHLAGRAARNDQGACRWHSHRPLARDPQKFEELFHERRACYARADYRIPVTADGSPGALEAILELPLF